MNIFAFLFLVFICVGFGYYFGLEEKKKVMMLVRDREQRSNHVLSYSIAQYTKIIKMAKKNMEIISEQYVAKSKQPKVKKEIDNYFSGFDDKVFIKNLQREVDLKIEKLNKS